MRTAYSKLRIQKHHFHTVADHLVNTLYAMELTKETIGEMGTGWSPLAGDRQHSG